MAWDVGFGLMQSSGPSATSTSSTRFFHHSMSAAKGARPTARMKRMLKDAHDNHELQEMM